jgi:hypothetical protein
MEDKNIILPTIQEICDMIPANILPDGQPMDRIATCVSYWLTSKDIISQQAQVTNMVFSDLVASNAFLTKCVGGVQDQKMKAEIELFLGKFNPNVEL